MTDSSINAIYVFAPFLYFVLDKSQYNTKLLPAVTTVAQEINNLAHFCCFFVRLFGKEKSGLGRGDPSAIATKGGRGSGDGHDDGGAKWAVTELLDISDFDALVPRPALKFPFTLDDFQKQAVARLEV